MLAIAGLMCAFAAVEVGGPPATGEYFPAPLGRQDYAQASRLFAPVATALEIESVRVIHFGRCPVALIFRSDGALGGMRFTPGFRWADVFAPPETSAARADLWAVYLRLDRPAVCTAQTQFRIDRREVGRSWDGWPEEVGFRSTRRLPLGAWRLDVLDAAGSPHRTARPYARSYVFSPTVFGWSVYAAVANSTQVEVGVCRWHR